MAHTSHALASVDGTPPSQLRGACETAIEAARMSTAPGSAIEAALGALHEHLDEAFVAVLMLEHERLWLVHVCGQAMIPEGIPVAAGIVGRAARETRPQLVHDVGSDPDFIATASGIVSQLALPLTASEGIVGVLDIETFSPLPECADAIAADLASVLAPFVQELRNDYQAGVSSLARLFVYLSSLRDPALIGEVVVGSLPRLLPVETTQLALRDEAGRLVAISAWQGSDHAPEPLALDVLESLHARLGRSAVFELLDTDALRIAGAPDGAARRAFVLPLRASGKDVGMLVGASRFGKELDRSQAEAAALLAAHTAASLDAAFALDRERHSALTDPLTGLLNRRGMEERLERELEQAQANRRPLSVVVIDCDDFKDVNDRAGHEFGDALLREIGQVLGAIAADVGRAARLGGDEFVVMLPATGPDLAEAIALDLQTRLAAGLDEAGFPLHLSVGVSTYPYDGAGATQVLRSADQALYEAKARGKDRVVSFRDLVRRGNAEQGSDETVSSGRRRSGTRPDVSALEGTMEAATAIWMEQTPAATLERLAKSLVFVVGAIAVQVSRIDDGNRLVDIVRHKLRDVDLGEDLSYLIDDFPVTKQVLESGVPRALSFLDENLDPAEAFVLREVQMNCCMLLPLSLERRAWGLVELYDMRLRRFTREDQAVADFLVQQAARRLEAFGELGGSLRLLPIFRPLS